MSGNERDFRSEEEKLMETYDNINYQAEKLIFGDRNKTYGHPLDDFTTTAEFWTTWPRSRGLLSEDREFNPEDVAAMMAL